MSYRRRRVLRAPRYEPLVSVLTPSLNQGRWIQTTIDSVASQGYSAIEHIVMDGGSSDETSEILRGAPPSLYYEQRADEGQSHALNKAYAASSGEIIGWLNSDDAYFSKRAVEAAVEAFRVYPDAAVVYGHSALVDAHGRLLHFNWVPPFSRALLKLHNFIVQPAAFVRRSMLDQGHFVDDRFDYAMDRELWLRLTAKHAAVRVGEVLAIDRHHDQRKSYTRLDLGERDTGLLVQLYGVPPVNSRRAALKAAKVTCRLAGSGLAAQPRRREGAACAIAPTSTRQLLVRQALLSRQRMTKP